MQAIQDRAWLGPAPEKEQLRMCWLDYGERHSNHTVVGTLKQREAVYSPQLDNYRNLLVWLPPDYATTTRRYPVLYLHDGQNLFDQFTSYSGEWRVDETMLQLSYEGYPAIIVGVPNMGSQRINEYSPFHDPHFGGGRGEQYVAFIAKTLKPMIDQEFRTLPQRQHTGIVGSSMGGLISLYGFFHQADVFGCVASLSPSLWFARKAIFRYVTEASYQPGSVYLDVGGREGPSGAEAVRGAGQPNLTLRTTREMQRLLRSKGYRPDTDLLYIEAPEATHSEAAWAERLPGALRFLLWGMYAASAIQG